MTSAKKTRLKHIEGGRSLFSERLVVRSECRKFSVPLKHLSDTPPPGAFYRYDEATCRACVARVDERNAWLKNQRDARSTTTIRPTPTTTSEKEDFTQMGFSFRIGEYTGARGDGEVWEDARPEEHPGAPADGVPTDRTNARWPSYGGWYEFAEDTGLLDLFPGRETPGTLLPDHPGVADLTAEHLSRFEEAQKKNRKVEHKGRLAWLVYWTKWALKNCKRPVIANH